MRNIANYIDITDYRITQSNDGYFTTAAASQVIATYTIDSPPTGNFIGVLVDFEIVGGNGTAGTGSAKLSGTFVVDSSGAITRIAADDLIVKGMNGATFTIDISIANNIKLEVTPGSAVANSWRIFLQAVRGLGVST